MEKAAVIISILLVSCYFDDANWVAFGGAGAFAPHKTIHMLGEDVNITLYDDKIHVRVFFSFENRGPATTVKMAFPFESTGGFSLNPKVFHFRTYVDGVEVASTKVNTKPITAIGQAYRDEGADIAEPFVMVKEVSFARGQRRTASVDYAVPRAGFAQGCTADEYILRTGSSWAGKIGQCSISVDWSLVKTQGMPSLKFERHDYSEVPIKWTFTTPTSAVTTITDFEPDFDLDLSSSENFWHVTINDKRVEPWRAAAIHDASFEGPQNDPTILVRGLYDFFTEKYSDERRVIVGSAGNAFGNSLSLIDRNTILDGLQRKHRLARPSTGSNADYQDSRRVRLKDLVEVLGGTFKWNAEWVRIDITMPTRKSPIRKPKLMR